MSSRSPASSRSAGSTATGAVLLLGQFPAGGRSAPALGFAAGGAPTTTQRDTGLAQDPVHETVGTAGRSGQGADALARVVPLLQVRCELGAIGTGHPGAFLEGF